MKLFALHGSRELGQVIAKHLNLSLSDHEERNFEDGEHKARPLESVVGQDVFVIHSLYSDRHQSVNDKLCRLLFFIGTLCSASAQRVIPVVPYLCYARKDRKTKPQDPVTSQYIARLFEAMGAAMFVGLDVHNLPAYQNAFRIPTHHLEARRLFIDSLLPELHDDNIVILSPDAGGVKRSEKFRDALSQALEREVDSAFMEKHRSEGKISGSALVGPVKDRLVLIVDDLISSGTTMSRAASSCMQKGAKRVCALASHGLFTGEADDILAGKDLHEIWITDTIPAFRLPPGPTRQKLKIISCAPLLAEAITRIHSGESLVDLLAL